LSTIAFFVLANKFEKKITNPRVVRHFYPAKYCPVADAIERIYKDYDVRVDCAEFSVVLRFFLRKIAEGLAYFRDAVCTLLVFLKLFKNLRWNKNCESTFTQIDYTQRLSLRFSFFFRSFFLFPAIQSRCDLAKPKTSPAGD